MVLLIYNNSASYSKVDSTGLVLLKSNPFLGASLDSVVANTGNLEEEWKLNLPHQNLIKLLMMF